MASRIPCMPNLVRYYPLISCLTLLLFIPPVFRLLLFFSPLLVSTALCVLALVSLGPHLAASEGHSKIHGVGLTPDYWHLGDGTVTKKFEDCLNENSGRGLVLNLESCGEASASNHFMADMHDQVQMMKGNLAWKDQRDVERNSNSRSAAFKDCSNISDEEGHWYMENTTSLSADIGNQALTEPLHEVPFQMNDLDFANKIPGEANNKMTSDLSGLESEPRKCEKAFKLEEGSICEESIGEREVLRGTLSGLSMENQEGLVSACSEERNRGTSDDGVKMLNQHESQNLLELKQTLFLDDEFLGKIPEEVHRKIALTEEPGAVTRDPSNVYRKQLLEHRNGVSTALKQQILENGSAQSDTAMALRCDQDETLALQEGRCRPRGRTLNMRRTSTQETGKSTSWCMQQLQDEPSAGSTLYGLATGFHSSFDPWESSIWGRDPIQEETTNFAIA